MFGPRRFQKIIEETLTVALLDLRKTICDTASGIARQPGIRNAGNRRIHLRARRVHISLR